MATTGNGRDWLLDLCADHSSTKRLRSIEDLLATHPEALEDALKAALHASSSKVNKQTVMLLLKKDPPITDDVKEAARKADYELCQLVLQRAPTSAARPSVYAPAPDPIASSKRRLDEDARSGAQRNLACTAEDSGTAGGGAIWAGFRQLSEIPTDFVPYLLTEFKAVKNLTDDDKNQAVQYACLVETAERDERDRGNMVSLDSLALINFGVPPRNTLGGQWFAKRTGYGAITENWGDGDFDRNLALTSASDAGADVRRITARYLQRAAQYARNGVNVVTEEMEEYWTMEKSENSLRDRAAMMMRAMLPEMQREVMETCGDGHKYTWDITTERLANCAHETKKRYDFILWRADGIRRLEPTHQAATKMGRKRRGRPPTTRD